ncbi:MAG TPA: thioesterase family protein [Candidatus Nanopelagicales bacterium]|nr:thioesterase family protein [Candidatus Nanopelagicales bacterium]
MTSIELDERWHITGHLNGGYLAAVCGQLASERLGGAAPFTISTHYLAPARGSGPADVEVEVLREGRLSTARVRLLREGVLLLESLVTAGTPKSHEALREDAGAPDLPAWDDLPRTEDSPFAAQPGNEVLRHVDVRLHPDDAPAISGGAPLARAVVRGRMAYRDGSPADLFLASAAWDLLPPTPWFVHVWTGAPTVAAQLVLYPGAIEGPLILEARAETIREGIADETARVWDARGHLVVSSRQTAIIT